MFIQFVRKYRYVGGTKADPTNYSLNVTMFHESPFLGVVVDGRRTFNFPSDDGRLSTICETVV